MPCFNPNHKHTWTGSGVLVIERCEKQCGYCGFVVGAGGGAGHNAATLRRHAGTCKSRPQEVTVSSGWSGKPRGAVKRTIKARAYVIKKKRSSSEETVADMTVIPGTNLTSSPPPPATIVTSSPAPPSPPPPPAVLPVEPVAAPIQESIVYDMALYDYLMSLNREEAIQATFDFYSEQTAIGTGYVNPQDLLLDPALDRCGYL